MRALTLVSTFLVFSLISHGSVATRTVNHQEPKDIRATLNNKDVVDMVKIGVSPDVVIAKIKASRGDFDTSPAAMQDLKAAGVPDAVILAMVEAPLLANKGETIGTGPAVVYVYRHKNFGTRNMQPSVYVDGVEVARMDDGKFFTIKLDPGKHSVEINKGHSGAEIDMAPGGQYYFRVDIIPGFWKARGQITYVQKEQGALELKKMKPLESKWLKDKRVTAEEIKP